MGRITLTADTLEWFEPAQIDADFYDLASASYLDEVPKANEIFGSNGAGVSFNSVSASWSLPGTGIPLACGSTPPTGKCNEIYINDCLGLSTNDARLKVVNIDLVEGSNMGLACKDETTGASRFVFIKTGNPYPEVLAHEFGHILGHTNERVGFSGGHVVESPSGLPGTGTPGFFKNNLMHDRVSDVDRDHLTVGQIFRMIFDKGSWYQKDPDIPNRVPGRDCGCEPYVSEFCPQLQRDPNQGARTDLPVGYCLSGTT